MHSSHPNFIAPNAQTEERIDAMLAKLSMEDKIDLLGGSPDRRDGGDTVSKPAAGLPSFKMADASVGIHWWTDPSTTYPATIGLAATFNKELAQKMGESIGRDARARGIHILLGPGVNIYRSPLCGRNFEYLGEDPVLAAAMVVPYIRGCQSQGVSTTVKHFALNFQEYSRHKVSSDVDERTLREIYLPAFAAAIREGGSGALMTAYNSINGMHCAEHEGLINGILKGEWGFDGLVMSDWTSVYDAVHTANAGLDMEMPVAKWLTREKLLPAIKNGLVSEAVIDDKVRRLLRLAVCFGWLDNQQQDETLYLKNNESGAAVSLDVAREACVLLKNDNLLPLSKKTKSIAVIGPTAHPAVVGGGGSAYNTSWRTVSIVEGIRALAGDISVAHAGADLPREQVLQLARESDVVVFCGGFTQHTEYEDADRTFAMDVQTENLLIEVTQCNPNTVVILTAGGNVDMRAWIDKSGAILHAWYPGQEGGTAVAEILFGKVNPSGRLPATFEKCLEDRSSFACYHDTDNDLRVAISDGIFTGYRHVDRTNIEPQFPFGFGLSYTTFAYTNLRLSAEHISNGDLVTVLVDVTNTGKVPGKEVVQLYLSDNESKHPRPIKELKAFEKILLQPGETKTAGLSLNQRAMSYFDPDLRKWVCEPGVFTVHVGASSRDIRLSKSFWVK